MKKIFIVAEIGCNHNGSKELARQMVLKAKECGVDAVKFQTFNSDALVSKYAPKAEYQKNTTGNADSQLDMIRKLELSQEAYIELRDYARNLGLEVFSTPFDLESIDFLYKNGQRIWKIPSGEVTNLPYLQKIGALKCEDKRIVVSSGMATVEEMRNCIDILVKSGTPASRITMLQCNTEYPTPDEDINLLAIIDLKANFPELEIGLSDHSVGTIACVGAVVLGISMIEKHFTLDKNFQGPDHKASANPEELKALVENIRRAEVMCGSSKKIVTSSERKNMVVARKSIVARTSIKKGEMFSEANITCKRPGNGISPMNWYELIGKTAEADFEPDQLIIDSHYPWQE